VVAEKSAWSFDARFSLYESTGSGVHIIPRMYEPECTNQIAVVAEKISKRAIIAAGEGGEHGNLQT
jgi:hypothetical protein